MADTHWYHLATHRPMSLRNGLWDHQETLVSDISLADQEIYQALEEGH